MGMGVLKQGFTINNCKFRVEVPANTLVSMGYSEYMLFGLHHYNGVPTVWFLRSDPLGAVKGVGIKLLRIDGRWFADCWGLLLLMEFPKGSNALPYPLSYFKS